MRTTAVSTSSPLRSDKARMGRGRPALLAFALKDCLEGGAVPPSTREDAVEGGVAVIGGAPIARTATLAIVAPTAAARGLAPPPEEGGGGQAASADEEVGAKHAAGPGGASARGTPPALFRRPENVDTPYQPTAPLRGKRARRAHGWVAPPAHPGYLSAGGSK